jgi:hypothetical protein
MKRLTLDGRDDGDNEGRRFSWLLVHFAGMFVHRRLEFMCILAGFWAFASTLMQASLSRHALTILVQKTQGCEK